jgi:hypothetical protein
VAWVLFEPLSDGTDAFCADAGVQVAVSMYKYT